MNTSVIKFPKYNSLTGRALALFLQNGRINHDDFFNHSASYRLAVFVDQLRNKMGWPIQDTWYDSFIKDSTGRKVKFKRYFITVEDLVALKNRLGERIASYIEMVKKLEDAATTDAQEKGNE